MNFAFLALACFAKKTSQKRSCTHPRIPPSRTARESGAPFTWKSHARDQNGKDGATRHQHHVSFRESTTRAGHPANSARERAPLFLGCRMQKPKREQGGPPVQDVTRDMRRKKTLAELSMVREGVLGAIVRLVHA